MKSESYFWLQYPHWDCIGHSSGRDTVIDFLMWALYACSIIGKFGVSSVCHNFLDICKHLQLSGVCVSTFFRRVILSSK